MWDATHYIIIDYRPFMISIHAPHVGCDFEFALTLAIRKISIHAPHVGCDVLTCPNPKTQIVFQSTHPMWDATTCEILYISNILFQSTHPMWDATFIELLIVLNYKFQSTHPMWDATKPIKPIDGTWDFNPRTPCGMRLKGFCMQPKFVYFNPRTPCGMRL